MLTIQGPVERGRAPRQVDVPDGHSAAFGGCGCDSCAFDIRLPGAVAPDFRGELDADRTTWWVTNTGDREPLLVADVDHPDETVAVRPGERVPFAFDMALIRPSTGPLSVTVFATLARSRRAAARPCPGLDPVAVPHLDRTSRYYAVLAELCGTGPMPTSAGIAARLGMSPRAVDAHIDYLIDKLGIPAPAIRSTGWKRTALVAHVRRAGAA
ncbi:hypothetical protein GCM10022243_19650 [Saccharothrix violaceirubra]|uniref:Uncharacterized protein n=1 Tax=Saccharothrix violaceirubra TaxID=413306 RepID=A0A7W7T252_9PSEU|nr:hypothetical protein [Saccharothrix violaceirubra]MBB4965128.1 hypothetical protein [Saccharothrix violaceirubra]